MAQALWRVRFLLACGGLGALLLAPHESGRCYQGVTRASYLLVVAGGGLLAAAVASSVIHWRTSDGDPPTSRGYAMIAVVGVVLAAVPCAIVLVVLAAQASNCGE